MRITYGGCFCITCPFVVLSDTHFRREKKGDSSKKKKTTKHDTRTFGQLLHIRSEKVSGACFKTVKTSLPPTCLFAHHNQYNYRNNRKITGEKKKKKISTNFCLGEKSKIKDNDSRIKRCSEKSSPLKSFFPSVGGKRI